MIETIEAGSVGQAKRILVMKEIRYSLVKKNDNIHSFYNEGSILLAVFYADRKELKIFLSSQRVPETFGMPYRLKDIK